MSALLWMYLGAATVFAGQAIGWWLARREAEAVRAAKVLRAAEPQVEREATYREAAPAPEPALWCEWSAAGGGEFCGEPCGPDGLCPAHADVLERSHGCDDPSCPSNNASTELLEQRLQRLEQRLSVKLPRDRVTEWPSAVFEWLAKDARRRHG